MEKLMNEEIEALLPPIGFAVEKKEEDRLFYVKYECPIANWLVSEYDAHNRMFYGYVDNFAMPQYSSWGYFTLAELEDLQQQPPTRLFFVRRDTAFKQSKVSAVDGVSW